jgi:hypothetical protein
MKIAKGEMLDEWGPPDSPAPLSDCAPDLLKVMTKHNPYLNLSNNLLPSIDFFEFDSFCSLPFIAAHRLN